MIYLVSKNKALFETPEYQELDFVPALDMLKSLKDVQIDSETQGLDCHTKPILTLQLGCTEFQIVFDWSTLNKNEKEQIKEYLESDRLFIGHNLMFDLTFLYKENMWVKNIYDTMIAEQLIYLGYPRILTVELVDELGVEFPMYKYVDRDEKGNPVKPHYMLSYSLQKTAERRLGITIDKTVRGKIINEGLTPEVVKYAGGDVMWLEKIRDSQLKELEEQNLTKACKFECEFIKPLAYVKYCGIHLDPILWKNKMESDVKNLQDALEKLNSFVIDLDNKGYIYRYATSKKELERIINLKFERYPEGDNEFECWRKNIKGMFAHINLQQSLFEEYDETGPKCDINWSSSAQVIKLFELLGIQVKTFDKKTKKEKKSIEENQIKPQKDKFPIINDFLQYQGAAKVVSTYGQNWLNAINPKTGRIHVELHSIGTDTSRISSGGGVYKLNLTNLPHDPVTRSCFTAEKGNVWLSIDYTGQESYLTASVANDKVMLDVLTSGRDLHSEVARAAWPDILGNLSDEVIKDQYHELRFQAKGIEFGILYGGDANTLKANKGFSQEEAERIYNNFMSKFNGLKAYQEYCRKNVLEKGYILMNPNFGHRAHIFDAEWMFKMQEKFKDHEFWQYYREMKKDSPSCDTVKSVKRYFKRAGDSGRQAINYRIQNRGAMTFKLAMIKLFNWVLSNNYQNIVKFCAFVHDEANIECPKEMAEDVANVVIKCMEAGGKPFCTRAHLGADLARNKDGTLPTCWVH